MNPSQPPRLRRGLYAITPDEACTARLLARVEPVLAAGVSCLQYRNKSADARTRHAQAERLLPLCRASGVALVINDDMHLAAAIGADGVHLGGDDGDIGAARRLLGAGAILGASCYDRIDLATQAAARGATYVAFGAFHPSPTKPHAVRAHPSLLTRSAALGLPRVAIGGITAQHAPALVTAGADLIAVISGIFDAPDPAAAVRAYLTAFKEPDA
jgi:thiamine-phosphate pyrophosphorylase